MKITDILSRYNVNNDKTRPRGAQSERGEDAAAATVRTEDSLAVSKLAKDLQRVPQILADDEDKQRQKVVALKEKIAKGEYNPSSQDVAAAINDTIFRNG